jgi:hypothetical protein
MTSLSPSLQAVVALFRGPLNNIRFGDIDAAGLSSLAAEAEGAAAEVEAQEAKLVSLRQELAQKQEALLGLAQQALAYARIYAEGDDALTAELNDIALPRSGKPRKVTTKPASARESSEPAPRAESEAAEATPTTNAAAAEDAAEPESQAAQAKPGRRKVQRRLGRAADRGDSV